MSRSKEQQNNNKNEGGIHEKDTQIIWHALAFQKGTTESKEEGGADKLAASTT
jgi:hypothetical protein